MVPTYASGVSSIQPDFVLVSQKKDFHLRNYNFDVNLSDNFVVKTVMSAVPLGTAFGFMPTRLL